ncbi:GNAT family N-acetyltransferase [Bacillus sp. HMF5848]|uniref:GNAT family N-acetyltransferase n=1 Tax=Bacillus sp. HMF5848 TaxID=2495421 RepID=UPI000F78E119|nr:GNAT family N-acetyltransferase [Bacillus sp. HMF5848]RSK26775.1 GNAT family N-acetyltransferase [Bacillus sp. HMF5848]
MKLTDVQLRDIQALQQVSEHEETISLKLNWDMLTTSVKNDDSMHQVVYKDDMLIAFLGVYWFGQKVELCGMVHPAFRGRGIFSELLNITIGSCQERNATTILLNAPAKSTSAKLFLSKQSFDYNFSEYQMMWTPTNLTISNQVSLRKADDFDLPLETQLDVVCFHYTYEDATKYNISVAADQTSNRYIIEFNETAVGKLRTQRLNGETWIYGISVLPEYQRKGVGRSALSSIIWQEASLGNDLFLEVATKNIRALKLYEECGFKIVETQDYYLFKKGE